jgi:hypothetical protein
MLTFKMSKNAGGPTGYEAEAENCVRDVVCGALRHALPGISGRKPTVPRQQSVPDQRRSCHARPQVPSSEGNAVPIR